MLFPTLILLLTLAARSLVDSTDFCSDPNCSCNYLKVVCRCRGDADTLVINPFYEYSRTVHTLEVTNCFNVSVTSRFFLITTIKDITFKDIGNLYFKTSAFLHYGTEFVRLLIENVESFSSEPNSMSGIFKTVTLRNVNSDELMKGAISFIRAENLDIINCNFQRVKSFAFSINELSRLLVSNTRLEHMQSWAFKIDIASEVTFINSAIGNLESDSISIQYANTISIINCQLEDLHSSFLRTASERFVFSGNIVLKAESEAFSYVIASRSIEVTGNCFQLIETNGLPNLRRFSSFNVSGNKFNCDSNLNWLLQKTEDHFLSDGECMNGANVAGLNYVHPKPSSREVCLEIAQRPNSTGDENEASSSNSDNLWTLTLIPVCVIVFSAIYCYHKKYKSASIPREIPSVSL